MTIKRCELRSLTEDDRWSIGHNELSSLRMIFEKEEISKEIYEKRRKSIVDFMSGNSDRIDSAGVTVEFFVS